MEKQERIISIESRLNALYTRRRKSDDAALKCYKDGLVFAEKYPDLAAERREITPQIEALKEELKQVKAMPEEDINPNMEE